MKILKTGYFLDVLGAVFVCAVFLVSCGVLFYQVLRILDEPMVFRSWSTQECVKVEPESAGTCEDLPDRYGIVWVR